MNNDRSTSNTRDTTEPPPSAWLHRLCLALAVATFPLIFMGGLVTTHGMGMSVPDWPNSYGYNMFLFPASAWVDGIFFEHTHRLLGTVVGFIAILVLLHAWGPARSPVARRRIGFVAVGLLILTLASAAVLAAYHPPAFFKWFQHVVVGFASFALIAAGAWSARVREPRAWVRWLSVVTFLAVCIQGTLGGLRVTMVNLDLAIVHACFAQAFLCLAGAMCVVTSRWWSDVARGQREKAGELVGDFNPQSPVSSLRYSIDPTRRRLFALAVLCVVTIYAQLIVGALMRHYRAGLAIHDLPLAFGKILPPISQAGIDLANRDRAWLTVQENAHWSKRLEPVTLTKVWLHFGHRTGAVVVSILLIMLIMQTLRSKGLDISLRRPAALLIPFLTIQVTLGLLTVYYRKPAEVASLHVAVGALLLLTTFVLCVRAGRVYSLLTERPVVSPVPASRGPVSPTVASIS